MQSLSHLASLLPCFIPTILLSLPLLTCSVFSVSTPFPHPPAWPCRFVSVLFSLTVITALLLCILRERTMCLPGANPRPLHNCGWPCQCTGQLTWHHAALSADKSTEDSRGPCFLSILRRQWYGQSQLPLWPVLFIKPPGSWKIRPPLWRATEWIMNSLLKCGDDLYIKIYWNKYKQTILRLLLYYLADDLHFVSCMF